MQAKLTEVRDMIASNQDKIAALQFMIASNQDKIAALQDEIQQLHEAEFALLDKISNRLIDELDSATNLPLHVLLLIREFSTMNYCIKCKNMYFCGIGCLVCRGRPCKGSFTKYESSFSPKIHEIPKKTHGDLRLLQDLNFVDDNDKEMQAYVCSVLRNVRASFFL